MSEPHLDLSDWFTIVASSIVSGLLGAMSWFMGTKRKLETRMDAYEAVQSKHDTQLAVIHTNQDHLSNRMDEVRELAIAAHDKLDEVLREVRRRH